jgi:hypothetical protein
MARLSLIQSPRWSTPAERCVAEWLIHRGRGFWRGEQWGITFQSVSKSLERLVLEPSIDILKNVIHQARSASYTPIGV